MILCAVINLVTWQFATLNIATAKTIPTLTLQRKSALKTPRHLDLVLVKYKCNETANKYNIFVSTASNKCVTDHDCHSMEDARCHFGNCTCGEDSMESADKTKCLQCMLHPI